MADYGTIKTAIADKLAESTHLVIAYGDVPENIVTPCAVVFPSSTPVEYGDAMARGVQLMSFDISLFVQRFDMLQNLVKLDPLIYGDDSIEKLFADDPTLSGAVQFAQIVRVTSIGNVAWGDDLYIGCELELEVMVQP